MAYHIITHGPMDSREIPHIKTQPRSIVRNDVRIHINVQLIGSVCCKKIDFQVKMN